MTAASPYRLAISGCGAVTELCYAPAIGHLRKLGEVSDITVFDPDEARAKALSETLTARVAVSFEELARANADLVIIASPPFMHRQQAIDALEAGSDVLCEKPLAINPRDAQDMIGTAERAGRQIFAGHVRRFLPTTGLIGTLIRGGLIGVLESVQCFEGGPFNWPVQTPRYFLREVSGGGVFSDVGSHCLDLLQWWIGPPIAAKYWDDAYGGSEANCLAILQYSGFEARVRLSRDWHQPNLYRFQGSEGWLEWEVNDAAVLRFARNGEPAQALNAELIASPRLSPLDPFVAAFVRQIRSALANAPHAVRARDVLPTVSLIDSCYASGMPLASGWLSATEAEKASILRGVPA